jgi:hypothetical protein
MCHVPRSDLLRKLLEIIFLVSVFLDSCTEISAPHQLTGVLVMLSPTPYANLYFVCLKDNIVNL